MFLCIYLIVPRSVSLCYSIATQVFPLIMPPKKAIGKLTSYFSTEKADVVQRDYPTKSAAFCGLQSVFFVFQHLCLNVFEQGFFKEKCDVLFI